MRRIDLLRARPVERSTFPTGSFQDYVNSFVFQAHEYGLMGTMAGSRPEMPDPHFVGYVRSVHQRNGVVSAAVVARALLMSQVRFVWRSTRANTAPGATFGNATLGLLERPAQTTRSDLLYRMEMDASYAGNSYLVRKRGGVFRLRPDFVQVVLGSDQDPTWDGDVMVPPSDAREVGILYQPRNGTSVGKPEVFVRGEYAHWMPEPDPIDFWRGSSWISSVLRDISLDGQVTEHQSKFFEHAATPNLVFIMDPSKTPGQVSEFADVVNARHAGVRNHFKNMFLGGGSDVKVVGSDLSSLGLKDVQGGFESRIASRSRVPAVVLGIREGLAGSALNSGNYAQTRRLWADGWFSPTCQSLCGAVEQMLPVPGGDAELWYDKSEVLFLQEDEKDAAEIVGRNATTITGLVKEGFTADSATAAVLSGDLSKLVHTGLVSVQLQAPGAEAPGGSIP